MPSYGRVTNLTSWSQKEKLPGTGTIAHIQNVVFIKDTGCEKLPWFNPERRERFPKGNGTGGFKVPVAAWACVCTFHQKWQRGLTQDWLSRRGVCAVANISGF